MFVIICWILQQSGSATGKLATCGRFVNGLRVFVYGENSTTVMEGKQLCVVFYLAWGELSAMCEDHDFNDGKAFDALTHSLDSEKVSILLFGGRFIYVSNTGLKAANVGFHCDNDLVCANDYQVFLVVVASSTHLDGHQRFHNDGVLNSKHLFCLFKWQIEVGFLYKDQSMVGV